MSHHGVSEIILKGTHKNLPFGKRHSDGPLMADSYLQWVEEKCTEYKDKLSEELYTIFMEQSTWVPYLISDIKVPVGAS